MLAKIIDLIERGEITPDCTDINQPAPQYTAKASAELTVESLLGKEYLFQAILEDLAAELKTQVIQAIQDEDQVRDAALGRWLRQQVVQEVMDGDTIYDEIEYLDVVAALRDTQQYRDAMEQIEEPDPSPGYRRGE